eukprot:CAMPEP_0176363760 /NCGR_PEP_ID=MMETSP0126-20121128/19325_1 /TAXON_ID=141414 ORGANISM="Strombidinopsis acuminatum, Strain SPMC142" /NCGR_SAMPLE_ID=MMETSP0126 /ASSEMBLY_ACC=CAM_ASM_000229 /LENGTH=46 /DNA_ID= /DNA_START= /DNA_END= /DNA_ORIENTATION=
MANALILDATIIIPGGRALTPHIIAAKRVLATGTTEIFLVFVWVLE